MKILSAVALAWMLGIAGCASVPVPPKNTFTLGDPVEVIVTAEKDLVVTREPIPVRARDVVLKWMLAQDIPYTFTANGIVITKAQNSAGQEVPIPAGEFDCGVIGVGKMFQCKDKNSTLGIERYYKYKISVLGADGAVLTLDPWINNH